MPLDYLAGAPALPAHILQLYAREERGETLTPQETESLRLHTEAAARIVKRLRALQEKYLPRAIYVEPGTLPRYVPPDKPYRRRRPMPRG